ncbi:thiamine biosynthesis protein ApbE [Alteromonadales bacterium alter-6D02]|nr:thiamine biosynthesis protein ApbE [Alteromonadales bacterium alter-6D02]
MGTSVRVELWSDDKLAADRAMASVMTEMKRIDHLMSPYKSHSELYLINQQAAKKPLVISDELYQIIDKSLVIAKQTQGSFDISFASIGFLYDYRNKVKPTNQQVDSQLIAINYNNILLDRNNSTIFFSHPNVKIDLGGIAKGYAVDNAISLLAQQGVKHALVTAGGDTKLLGDRRGRPWVVGIQDPRNKNKQAVKLPLINEALSTSGDYERYFEQDGVRYHHILNPKTGYAVTGVQSVSITGPQSIMTDALSTSVFVLGVKQGLALINSLDGYSAIIVDDQRKLHFSADLMAN